MPIQTTYRGVAQPDLATYDWYDLATGTGYKDFFGMDLIEGSTSLIRVLSTQTFYSMAGKATTTIAAEYNFDLEFEVPLTIDGVVLLNAPVSTAGNAGNVTLVFKIYRVDSGSNEHQIGSTVTNILTAFVTETRVNSIKFELTTPVRIKKGEKFRLSMAVTSTPGVAMVWYFDPKNRDLNSLGAAFVSSQLKLSLPIKLGPI